MGFDGLMDGVIDRLIDWRCGIMLVGGVESVDCGWRQGEREESLLFNFISCRKLGRLSRGGGEGEEQRRGMDGMV